jgi:L-ascorbate metabolism protein UlaG (beta-lactamase superfamily)
MEITKFAQSCILIETKGKRILIDPGVIQFDEALIENQWKDIDLILVTHKHGDHCNPKAITALMNRYHSKLYSTKEVADFYPELSSIIIKEGDVIELGEIKVTVVKAIHGYIPILKGEKKINENVGYIVEGDKKAYLAGDTICFENDYKCDIVFVPICNHGLVMGPFEAGLFAKTTEADLVVPVHYDNPLYQVNLERVEEEFEKQGLNYKILNIGERIKL